MASRQFLPTQHPVVDPKTGIITQPWLELFKTAVAAVEAGAGSTVWSTLNGVTDWRTLASLLTPVIVGNALPAGVIKQVVIGTQSTSTSSASATYADTGLTASITPSSTSSKILVLVFQAGIAKDTNNTGVNLKLLRGAVDLQTFAISAGNTGSNATNNVGGIGTAYLDSPASVSAQTYKTQFASAGGTANANVQASSDTSVIVLLEVQG